MDLNADGKLDILSGCYATHEDGHPQVFVLYGNGSLDFRPPTPLLNLEGAPVKALTFAQKEANKSTKCTHPYACDWDNDGDLDLVIGTASGHFHLVRQSQDTSGEIHFEPYSEWLTTPDGKPLHVPSGKSSPCVIDWDGDGDLDILSGSHGGGVYLFKNSDNSQQPKLNRAVNLIPSSKAQLEQAQEDLQPARYARIAVHDWNSDGLLDIILGDHLSVDIPLPNLKPDQYQALRSAHQDTDKLLSALHQHVFKLGADAPVETRRELTRLSQQCYELKKHFRRVKQTGHVWLFLAKPHEPN